MSGIECARLSLALGLLQSPAVEEGHWTTGRTAKAIRTLIGAIGSKFHKRFTLDIINGKEPSAAESKQDASAIFAQRSAHM